jgi:hypothetical protein
MKLSSQIENRNQVRDARTLLKILALGNREIEEEKVVAVADAFRQLRERRASR